MDNSADATRQTQAKAARLAQAFSDVFGAKETTRSASQRLVIEHLKYVAYDNESAYRFNEAKDGISLIAAGIHRDGAQHILRVIEKQLVRSTNAGKEVQPKTTKRK